MANPKAQIYSVPLQGEGSEINLTTYKTDISQFNGFNSKNAPFYGGTLSPMWYKKENTITTETYIAPNGDKYYVEDNNLRKNGNPVMNFTSLEFASKIVEDDYYDYREDGFYIKKEYTSGNKLAYVLYTPYGNYTRVVSDGQGNIKTYLYKYTGNGRTNNPIYCAIIDSIICIFTSKDTFDTLDLQTYDNKYVCICNSGVNFDCLTFCINGYIILYNETSLKSSKILSYRSLYEDENSFIYVSSSGKIISYQPSGSSSGSIYATRKILIPSTDRNSLIESESIEIHYRVVNSTGTEVDGNISTLSAPKTIKKLSPNNLYFTQYCEGADITVESHKVRNILAYGTVGDSYGHLCNFTKDKDYINNPFGYAVRYSVTYGEWRLLYHQGNIQNISFAKDQYKRGTIVAPWFTISNDKNIYVNDYGVIFYSEELKKWCEIRIRFSESNRNKITVIDNNYIIVNTISFSNAYIISENREEHFADDWNNRIGPRIYAERLGVALHYLDDFDTAEVYIASAVNPRYEKTGDPFCSLIMNPVSVKKVDVNGIWDYSRDKEEFWPVIYGNFGFSPIDVYIDMDYAYSLNESSDWGTPVLPDSISLYSRPSLEGTTYPVDMTGNMFMNIPILFDYIPSATNQDLVKLAGNVVYPVSYYNNQLIFLIPQLAENSIYGITDSFVIQGQPYAIANNKIVKYTIANSAIADAAAIMDISGLTYISATPYQAIFWSETNRTFYSFTGDRLVNPILQADSITAVGNKGIYNPATGSVIVPTNLGLFFLGIASQFILDKVSDVSKIYPLNNGVAVITPENIYYLSYNELEGYSTWPIKLDTKFYGLGNNMLSVNDTLYMMLFDDNPSKGQVKLKVTTLTNIGMTTEEKVINIKESDWDKITNTYYLRYQPKNQRSMGASYHIESDFRIGSISISNKPDTVQISNNNF